MMRVCPKCGDYYADALLAFCLVDGTSLANVSATSESWSEGARVIEEKGNALSTQKRRLKWRRVSLSAMAIATMAVCVVAASSFIYSERKQDEGGQDKPRNSIIPVKSDEPPPPPPSKCSIADESRERQTLIDKFGDKWRQNIEGDRREIIARNVPTGFANANVPAGSSTAEATLGVIEYEVKLSKVCTASVTARYAWQVKIKFNGTSRDVAVAKQKKFACVKNVETWRCR